ncbi:MAG: hypothetical protein K6E96_05085 [Bacteroidales bacterium]|nr:hypothetical protein [Bacteroidales bacterium]
MKKVLLTTVFLCAVAITACKGELRKEVFQEAEVLSHVSFSHVTTAENATIALEKSGFPITVETDCNGNDWLTPSNKRNLITSFPFNDGPNFICEVARITFNGEEWFRITYTIHDSPEFWMFMTPADEYGLFYSVYDLKQGYQFPDHSTAFYDSEGEHEVVIVRYPESGTFDTVLFTQIPC